MPNAGSKRDTPQKSRDTLCEHLCDDSGRGRIVEDAFSHFALTEGTVLCCNDRAQVRRSRKPQNFGAACRDAGFKVNPRFLEQDIERVARMGDIVTRAVRNRLELYRRTGER